MSYSRCYICRKDNYSGNETSITVERKTVDKKALTQRTVTFECIVCDTCLGTYFPMVPKRVMG